MNLTSSIILVGLGSAIGGVGRYLIGLLLASCASFPWATLMVNLIGSLGIGILSGFIAKSSGDPDHLQMIRSFAVVGICGGFTTFSTFSNETFRMIEANQWGQALLYAVVSLVLGITAVFLGYYFSS